MSAWPKKKKAKFFCEHCGFEVSSKAKVCTHCGRFFSSVRCPKCGREGSSQEFIHGCPDCGYAKKKSTENINIFSSPKKKFDSALPTWVYFFTLIILIVLVICLYSCL